MNLIDQLKEQKNWISIIKDDLVCLDNLDVIESENKRIKIVILEGEMSKTIPSFMSVVKGMQNFPEYFGKNWDAYNDSLRDVLWKSSADHDMYILLIKNMEKLLISENKENIAIFLKIFDDAIKELAEDNVEMIVKVVFVKSTNTNTTIENELKIDQDPECQFIKRWVPELRDFSAKKIACHETMVLPSYPEAIVNAEQSIRVMKERISAIRKSDLGKDNAQQILVKHGSRMKQKQQKKSRKREVNFPSVEQIDLFGA